MALAGCLHIADHLQASSSCTAIFAAATATCCQLPLAAAVSSLEPVLSPN